MSGCDLLEVPRREYVGLEGGLGELEGFRVLEKGELREGVAWGARYRTWCCNTPVYLSYLMRRFLFNGGRVLRRELESLHDAFKVAGNVRTVVNCSGMGFNDPLCFIIRGMFILT